MTAKKTQKVTRPRHKTVDFTFTVAPPHFETMREYSTFIKDMQETSEEGIEAYMEFVADNHLIAEWSLEGSPHDVDRLLDLSPQEWMVLNAAIADGMTKSLR